MSTQLTLEQVIAGAVVLKGTDAGAFGAASILAQMGNINACARTSAGIYTTSLKPSASSLEHVCMKSVRTAQVTMHHVWTNDATTQDLLTYNALVVAAATDVDFEVVIMKVLRKGN